MRHSVRHILRCQVRLDGHLLNWTVRSRKFTSWIVYIFGHLFTREVSQIIIKASCQTVIERITSQLKRAYKVEYLSISESMLIIMLRRAFAHIENQSQIKFDGFVVHLYDIILEYKKILLKTSFVSGFTLVEYK